MATTITERPYKYSFSENPILYKFMVTDPNTIGAAVQVEIKFSINSGITNTLISVELTPNPDGSVLFFAEKYLKSVLLPELPDPAGAVIQGITSQVVYFYINFREITTATPEPNWISDQSNVCIVLLGGIEQMKFKRNNFFATYLPATKTFLTWQPSKRFVFKDQLHYLTYLHTATSTSINVVIKTVFTDGSNQDISFTQVTNNEFILFRINTSVQKLGLGQLQPLKKIHYYEIKVTDQDNVALTSTHRFYIEYRPTYDFHDFNFFNSLGGIDPLRLVGEFIPSMEGEGEDGEQITGNDVLNNPSPKCQFFQIPLAKRDVYKGDAGWSRTPYLQEVLSDMFVRRQIYEFVDERWIRILNLKKSQELSGNRETTWNYPLEWGYGFEDNVVTPKKIMLGAGTQNTSSSSPSITTYPVLIESEIEVTLNITNAYGTVIPIATSQTLLVDLGQNLIFTYNEIADAYLSFFDANDNLISGLTVQLPSTSSYAWAYNNNPAVAKIRFEEWG